MKKIYLLLSVIFCFSFISNAQKTYVPDDNFENYLESNGMGDGIALNDSEDLSSRLFQMQNDFIENLNEDNDINLLKSKHVFINQTDKNSITNFSRKKN